MDTEDRRYQINTTELKDAFTQRTNHNISADKFKMCMMLCGVKQKKESHPFNTKKLNRITKEWEDINCNAGKYWCGLSLK